MMHFEEGFFGGRTDFHGLDRVFVHSFFQRRSIVDFEEIRLVVLTDARNNSVNPIIASIYCRLLSTGMS